jgi:Spy/CpxP family protein refolding chaperone
MLLSGTTVWAQTNAERDAAAAKQQQLDNINRDLENLKVKQAQGLSPLHPLQIQPDVTIRQPFYAAGQNRVAIYNNPRSTDPLAELQIAPGTWWNNSDKATFLNLTKDQQKKMDDIFQQYRLKLIDLNASLSKEEAILEPLMASEKLDEPKILTQIDRIAQARAELEKANSRMLLGIRQSLTMEQWTKIQSPGNNRLLRR